MMVGFTGIRSNQVTVDTVGDNIANVATTAFKSQRTLFETLMYRTTHDGTGPTAVSGGTLPQQYGTGSTVATLQRDFRQGSLQTTGFASDLALDGRGFFVLESATGDPVYTRDGAFHLDANYTMVSSNGEPLQVYAADATGAMDTSTLTNLVIPLGSASAASATGTVVMDGQLSGSAEPATQGAVLVSQPLTTASGSAATEATALTDLVDDDGVALFAEGDAVTINARKGPDGALAPATFVVGTDGRTLGDFAAYLEQVLRLDTNAVTGGGAGVTTAEGPAPAAGSLVITSNPGDVNAIELGDGAIRNTGSVPGSPLRFTTVTEAAGTGESTSFNVYDSLGNPVGIRVRAVMESRSEAGTTWRFYAESDGGTAPGALLGTGTITFDANGQFVSATNNTLSIDRAAAGAVTPLTVTLDFSGLTGVSSTDGSSQLLMASQDGRPAGLLTDYEIDANGIVTAKYSNTLTQTLGQVAVALFANEEGLVARSENRYLEGPNSGSATLTVAQSGGAGAVRSYTLEESNVEITREFINLISAQTGISAASRVVRTADDLLQQLLLLAR